MTELRDLRIFGASPAPDDPAPAEVFGGKGARLIEMSAAGLPVPPGMVFPVDWSVKYLAASSEADRASLIADAVSGAVAGAGTVEATLGRPALFAVRSGARVSMPGMMDTVLNVGLSRQTLGTWVGLLGERAALDSYRRLLLAYGELHGVPRAKYAAALAATAKVKFGLGAPPATEADFTVRHLRSLVKRYENLYEKYVGEAFPDSLAAQLAGAIAAVFRSWNSERARVYRKAHGIPDDWGTAVVVQAMVFGNRNDRSCSGVLFSRDPSSGEDRVVGEFLPCAQGEDVVAGVRTPISLCELPGWDAAVAAELTAIAKGLETRYRDAQDIEFTVEDGRLFILQTRSAKRAAAAAFRMAHEMYREGLISAEEALSRVTGRQYVVLRRKQVKPDFSGAPVAVGIPASAGIASGRAVFSWADAVAATAPVILVRAETSPEDFPGMLAAAGVLTTTGGATSHAAVVARGIDKPCVVGAASVTIGSTISDGDTVTIDGATGRVWVNMDVPVTSGEVSAAARALLDLGIERDDVMLRVCAGDHLPKCGRVFFDLSGTSLSEAANRLTALAEETGLTGIIGVIGQKLSPSRLRDALGLAPIVYAVGGEWLEALSWLQASRPTIAEVLAHRFIIYPPDGCSENMRKLLSRRWRLVSVANTIGDISTAFGAGIALSSGLRARLWSDGLSDAGINRVIAALTSVPVVPDSVPDIGAAFRVFGK